ncbi:winged helix-turn-helix domain-containing protein [Haloarchaeobius sp. HRN-SO-5]|uniref:winged helix-turn-helix domain-containing protein n=1 Tax=Haloarchaeobius sp. HRN-SO-5 TaxID=3446118 RepID=UPI003EBAEAA8
MDDVVVDRLPPEAAFELVAHETRVRVLQALLDADEPLAFSDLREAVGMRDTGQFNYHLGKLTDQFVTGEDGDGYALTREGARVAGAVLSGGYTKGIEADPVRMDATCPECEARLEARFHDTEVRITCIDCDLDFAQVDVPPGALDGHTATEAVDVAHRWTKRVHHTADLGFCYVCDGPLDKWLLDGEADDVPEWLSDGPFEAFSRYECQRCGTGWFTDVGLSLLSHPATAAFHYDHGVDVRETPLWELDWVSADATSVVGRDPLRAEVSVTIADETLTLTVDRDLTVVDERRTDS